MIRGTLNQLHNIYNRYQGETKKVLTVCSAGMLRSATLQNYLIREFGYNVRTCGTEDYALVPISEALVRWADEIIFVNRENYERVADEIEKFGISQEKIFVLDIPDWFMFNAPDLIEICRSQYASKVNESENFKF